MSKITLYLMGEKGLHVLNEFIKHPEIIECVILSKDNKIEYDYHQELIKVCQNNEILYLDKNDYPKCKSEFAIAVAWRWLINVGETKLITFHDSLLPKYRGFIPLVNQLINHEKEIGVTAIIAKEDYDTGNILTSSSVTIEYPIKIKSAIEHLSHCYIACSKFIISNFQELKDMSGTVQDESEATYSLWRDEEDYLINWNDSSEVIKRQIDATGYPYKGSKTLINGEYVTLNDVNVIDDVSIIQREKQVGKVIFIKNKKPVIICGRGLLEIEKAIKQDGSDALPFKNFRSRLK